jgi:hypothetical protein
MNVSCEGGSSKLQNIEVPSTKSARGFKTDPGLSRAEDDPTKFTTCFRWNDWVRAYRATAEFFDRRLAASGERQ